MSDIVLHSSGAMPTRDFRPAPEFSAPLHKAPDPWGAELLPFSMHLRCYPPDLTESHYVALKQNLFIWQLALHHFYRLTWAKGHKIPFRFKLAKSNEAIELKAKYLKSVYRCFETLHSLSYEGLEGKLPYPSAARWFRAFLEEQLFDSELSIIVDMGTESRKSSEIDAMLAQIAALRNGEHPFTEQQHRNFPATSLFYAEGLRYAELQEISEWRERRWKPMLSAWSTHVRDMRRPAWGGLFLSRQGDLRVQQGRGASIKVCTENSKAERQS
jgi:hypothetical protein